MKKSNEKFGCMWDPKDGYLYRSLLITWLKVRKAMTSNPKEKEEIEEEIKKLENYPPEGFIK